jgi:serine/threonine-protein kinase RsbW
MPQESSVQDDVPAALETQLLVRTPNDMARAIETMCAELRSTQFVSKEIMGIRLALEEAIVNSLKHGHQYDVKKEVHIAYSVQDSHFHAEITDQGPGFDSNAVPDPLADENLERPCGRGVFLIRYYMSTVLFNDRGNRVTMIKDRGAIDARKGK